MKNLLFLGFLSISLFAEGMQVFQPPTSTCPKSWFIDMENISSDINVVTMMNVKNLKKEIGIPKEIQSCNTTLLEDYVFEGNVPSQAIKDFLLSKPDKAIGLALPSSQNNKTPKIVYIIYEDETYKEFGKY